MFLKTGITLPGRSDVSLAATAPCRLQLSSASKSYGRYNGTFRNITFAVSLVSDEGLRRWSSWRPPRKGRCDVPNKSSVQLNYAVKIYEPYFSGHNNRPYWLTVFYIFSQDVASCFCRHQLTVAQSVDSTILFNYLAFVVLQLLIVLRVWGYVLWRQLVTCIFSFLHADFLKYLMYLSGWSVSLFNVICRVQVCLLPTHKLFLLHNLSSQRTAGCQPWSLSHLQ